MFTEQGIAMLSCNLRSDVAVQVSIRIMNTFVEVRRFIANNALLFENVSSIELKLFAYQKSTDVICDALDSSKRKTPTSSIVP